MGCRRTAFLSAAFAVLASAVAQAQTKPPVIWYPAAPDNYTTISYTRTLTYVVIHTVEGSAAGALSWFRNSSSDVSAHYVVGSTGTIWQGVADNNIAWHVGRMNGNAIGIEHEGYAYRNYWTDAQYRASAALTRWLCLRYGIPMDRSHIVGHGELPYQTHTDPGPYFNWTYYMSLVRQGSATPPSSSMLAAKQVNTSALNVRSGPSTGNSIIGSVANGQRYVAVEQQNGWFKIHYADNTGWCSGSYLAALSGVTGVKIDTAALNVRSGPGTGYGIVGSTSSGRRYVQITTSAGWRKIYWGGGAWWVSGSYAGTFGL